MSGPDLIHKGRARWKRRIRQCRNSIRVRFNPPDRGSGRRSRLHASLQRTDRPSGSGGCGVAGGSARSADPRSISLISATPPPSRLPARCRHRSSPSSAANPWRFALEASRRARIRLRSAFWRLIRPSRTVSKSAETHRASPTIAPSSPIRRTTRACGPIAARRRARRNWASSATSAAPSTRRRRPASILFEIHKRRCARRPAGAVRRQT